MAFICFEDLRVFQLAEKLCDDIWEIAGKWNYFEKDTVGKQLVRAADSIGANIAEGSGRGYPIHKIQNTKYQTPNTRIIFRVFALSCFRPFVFS